LAFAARVRELYPGAIVTTTMRTDGIMSLKALLRDLDRAGRPIVHVRLPVSDGARLAALYRDGEVLSRADQDGMFDVRVRLDRWQIKKLQREGIEVVAERAEERLAG
jgi:50S ribosomal subunit-associated GTPase HflX